MKMKKEMGRCGLDDINLNLPFDETLDESTRAQPFSSSLIASICLSFHYDYNYFVKQCT
jgi:hypothetical protein